MRVCVCVSLFARHVSPSIHPGDTPHAVINDLPVRGVHAAPREKLAKGGSTCKKLCDTYVMAKTAFVSQNNTRYLPDGNHTRIFVARKSLAAWSMYAFHWGSAFAT